MRNVEGAKAGSSQKKPYRAPVSATSTQRMRIKYGISEGTILGFGRNASYEEMLKRIYLDGTPIMSAEGDQLLDVTVEFRDGSQDQEPIKGLPSITVEHDVNVEVKLAAPVSRSFSRAETTSFDVRMSVPTLYEGNSDGDSTAGLVQFKIEVSTDGGAFVEAGRFDIYEKILNGFTTTYNVEVPKGLNHVVRISRLNSEVVSDYSVNKLNVDAIVEVTDVRLRYSNTAILYLEYDAEQFSNVPKLEMRIFGKNDILMPANYDPYTRTYAKTGAGTTNGVWDGTWKRDYTDNPVWISLDQLTATRYALGDKIDLSMVNKWQLYGISQYCDELVNDGKGGQEPRFTCNNMYMQKSEDAFRVLKDLAASFRAKVVWDGEFITLLADVPRDPVHTFTNANMMNITYSATQDAAQRNLINVQYYDRDNKFSSDVVSQRSVSNVLARGKVVDGNFTALGCASQGQAQRIASYVMNTELYETELISFTTGLEGGLVKMNDVINVADSSVAGRVIGGRIAAVNGRAITLDRPVHEAVQVADTTQLVINQESVKNEPISVVAISADRLTLTLATNPPAGTEAGLVWALLTQDLIPQKFTITDIEFNEEEMQFSISAIQYNETKYAAIDGSARVVVPPISVVEYDLLKAPLTVIATYLTRIVQDATVCDIDVSWAQSTNAVQYQLEMQKEGGAWKIIGRYAALATTLDNMYTGTYTFRVCAYDSLGNASPYTYADPILVAGKVLPPPLLAQYAVSGILFGYQHKWIYPAHTEDSRAVRLRFTTQDPVATPSQQWQYVDIAYPTTTFTEQDVSSGLRTWFSAAIVDKYGNVGAYTNWQSAVPSVDPSQVLDILDGQLSESQLNQDLINKIETGVEAGAAAENAQAAADSAQQAASNANLAASNAQAAASGAQTAANNAQASANAAAAEVQQLAQDVDADMSALSTDLNGKLTTLGNGLTQETINRQNADTQIVGQLNAYKTSNDAAVAGVLQKAEAATSASTANAQALTNLTATVNTKNRTYRQNAAPTTGLIAGDLWINTTAGKNNEVRRWDGTAWDDLTDPRTAANATALTNLQTTVSDIDGRTTANANSITQLRTDLTTLTNTVGTKADASALTSLQATVTQQGNTIASHTSALTSLQSQVTTNTNNIANKLDASAITNYYTKAEADTATAGAISTFNAGLVIGGENLYLGANPITLSGRVGELNVVTDATSVSQLFKYLTAPELDMTQLAVGTKTVSSMEFFIPSATNNNFEFRFAIYRFSGTQYVQTEVLKASQFPRDKWFRIALEGGELPAVAVYAANINISLYVYRRYVGDTIKWRNLMMEKGTKASAYSEPTSVLKSDIAANATAITQTKADVTTLNGTVTAQGTQLTNLSARITTVENGLATKADATALTNLAATVTQQGNTITSQGNALTSLTNRMTAAEGAISTKADATALTSLTTRVTNTENTLTSQGTQLTTLQNDLTVTTTTANAALPKISSAGTYKAFRNVLNNITMAGTIPATTNLVITTPITFSAKMTNLSIKGYMYKGTNDTTIDLRVGFYAYQLSSPFLNRSVTNNGSFPFKVRLGVKDDKAVVILSSIAATPTMSYPQFNIDAEFGYSLAPDTWKDGWACTQVPEADLATFGVTAIQTPPIFDPKTEITATATALTSLQNTVTQQGTLITSNSTAITNLNNSITSINSTLATKADSSALTTLESKVTANTNNITAQGTQLTQLGNRVTTVENGLATKADASALTSLTTRVTNAENTLSTQATQLTKLQSDLSGMVIGGTNLVAAANIEQGSLNESRPIGSLWAAMKLNSTLRIRCKDIIALSGGSICSIAAGYEYFAVYFDANQGYLGAASASGWKVVPTQSPAAAKYIAFALRKVDGTAIVPADYLDSKFQIEIGNVTTAWSPSPDDIPEIDLTPYAKASALTELDTKVTNIDNRVTSQATQLTSLQAELTVTTSNSQKALAAVTVTDTRSTNELPLWYWQNHAKRIVNEFKSASTLGITGLGNYVNLETRVYYSDATGGAIIQTAYAATNPLLQMIRRSSGSGSVAVWTAWEQPLKTLSDEINTKASATALSTLDSKVTGIDGRVAANSTQLTQLNSSLTTTNNNVTAAQNAADAAATLAGSKGKTIVQAAAPAAADRLVQNLWIDITNNANTPKRWNGTAWVAVTDKVATDAAAAAANALSVAQTKADASALTSLNTKVDTIDGKVTAQATQLTSLSTTVGNHTASITSQQTSIDGLSAKATLQVIAGNTVGGVTLGNNAGVVDFIVRANTFAIAPPVSANAGNAGKFAFQYRATPVTLPNGTVVPAGVYADNAVIHSIDASKLNVESLNAITANFGTWTTLADPAQPNKGRNTNNGLTQTWFDDNNVMRVRIGKLS